MLAMCLPASAQKNLVASIDYDYELTLYRPQITLSRDGTHAVAWESLAKLPGTEEWQIGVVAFSPNGSALDEAIYLRDPESCVREEVEGYRGVQNADIQFSNEGDLLVAMEPEIDVYNGFLHKQPRAILSTFNQAGQVRFQNSKNPCERSSSNSSDNFESERPRFDFLPQTGEVILVSTSESPFRKKQDNPFKTISVGDFPSPALASKHSGEEYVERWQDVAVSNLFSGYSWQRCFGFDSEGSASDCDVVVQFVPHSPEHDVLHTTKPIRVNAGDSQGVLNYRPSIAMNHKGESVVVWVDYRFSDSGDILAQRFDSTGWPLGENARISDGNGLIDVSEGIGPEVAMKNDGSYMVVWTQDNGEGRRAYGRMVSAQDHKKPPFLLDTDPHMESLGADVASNGEQFAYTWVSIDDYGPSVFYWVSDSELLTMRNVERPRTDFSFTGYPNPFSEETTLEYVLNQEGHVTLVIYDLLGREVKKLIDKWQAPGAYLVNLPGEELAVGYYVTKLQQGDLQFSKVLIRTP